MTRLATVSLAAVLSLGLPLPALAGSIGDEVKLNPQPLPPKEVPGSHVLLKHAQ